MLRLPPVFASLGPSWGGAEAQTDTGISFTTAATGIAAITADDTPWRAP